MFTHVFPSLKKNNPPLHFQVVKSTLKHSLIASFFLLSSPALSQTISENGTLTVNSDLTQAIDGYSEGNGTLEISGTVNSVTHNIGENNSLANVNIQSGAHLTVDNYLDGESLIGTTLSSSTMTLENNATLNVQSLGNFAAAVDGAQANTGTVNFATTERTVGGATFGSVNGLLAVNVADNTNLWVGREMKAETVTIGTGASGFTYIQLYDTGIVTGDLIIKSNAYLFMDRDTSVVGDVTLNEDSNLHLVHLSSVTGEIDGDEIGKGNIVTATDGTSDVYGNIGSNKSIANAILFAGSTLDLNNYSLSATTTEFANGSTLIVGTGSVTGAVHGQEDEYGTVRFTAAHTVATDFGTAEKSLQTIALDAGADVDTSSFNFDAVDITLASGSVLNIGSGSLNGNIASSGRINFGATARALPGNITGTGAGIFDMSTGSHTGAGTFTTSAGDSLAVDIIDVSSSGNFTAAGAVFLAEGTKLNITLDSSVSDAIDLAELSSTIISGGEGSTINVISDENININDTDTNQFESYLFRTYAVEDSLVLRVSVANTALSENPVFEAVDSIENPTGALAVMQTYLDSGSVSDTQKAEAVETLSPQSDNSTNRVAFNTANASVNIASTRLGAVRSLNFFGVATGDETAKNSVWIQQFGSSINQGNTAGSSGYVSKSVGTALGYDHEIFKDFILGFSASYSGSNTQSRSAKKEMDIDTYQGNIYTGYTINDKYFINTILGMALNKYSSSRIISAVGAVATAKYSGKSYIGRVEVGLDHKFSNDLIFTPTFMITAARNKANNYAEEGAGTLSLNVQNSTSDFFETRLGTQLSREYTSAKGNKFVPTISLSYGYDFAASKQVTNSNFIGQTASFTSTGAKVVHGSWMLGTGLKIYGVNDVTLSANYGYDYRDKYHGHIGSLKLKYNF